MEEDGLVGGFQGSKSREVLMILEDWRIREESIRDELDRMEQEEAEEDQVEGAADADAGGAAAGEFGSSHGANGEDSGSESNQGPAGPTDSEATWEHEAQGP